MRSRRHAALAVLAMLAIALTAGSTARADGDPASDVLYTNTVFFSFTTAISKSAQSAVTRTVASAKQAGYPIRVAVIEKESDLGAVTSLWGKPRAYAKFLDIELSFIYEGPLLIVMPSGLGYARYKQPAAGAYGTLAAIKVRTGPDGLALTANDAVARLASRAGHRITPATIQPGGGGGGVGIGLIGGGAAAAVALVAGAVLLQRRLPGR